MNSLMEKFAELVDNLGMEAAFDLVNEMIKEQNIERFEELEDAIEEELILMKEAD